MKIHFILVEPAVPENIGAAARAIKTMGFDSLWIVNSNQYKKDKARYVAHGSNEILDNIRHFPTFNEMMDKLDFSIATSSKTRSVRYDYIEGKDLPGFILQKQGMVKSVGIIFGREEYGLSNEEIKKCDMVSSIPLNNPYPSLNLGQSVMLYAYILNELTRIARDDKKKNINEAELQALKNKVEDILPRLNMGKETNIYGRIFERIMHITKDDIHLLHSVVNKLQEKLNNQNSAK